MLRRFYPFLNIPFDAPSFMIHFGVFARIIFLTVFMRKLLFTFRFPTLARSTNGSGLPLTIALSTLLGASFLASPAVIAEEEVAKPPRVADELSSSFEQVAELVTPSVVTISTETKSKKNPQQRNLDPLKDFFGEDFMDRFGGQGPQRGLGTGVIIDDQGHILTNNHVIGDADEVKVRLYNSEKTVKAEVVGVDPRTDLAVIKIKAKDKLPKAAKLGDSDRLKIGEWVVAIGASFGLENTITAGIVSAKGRNIGNAAQYEDYIQTDAAINPGNSGGPLVNLRGEVVGINTAIVSRSGGYMGIGFAIPIDMARSVMESLVSKGKVTRGWLGVGIQNLNEGLAQSFNYPSTEGALVGHIDPRGPARDAGLKQGDIIVGIDSVKILNINQLRNYVAKITPGTEVSLNVIREGRKLPVPVKIGELPTQPGDRVVKEGDSSEEELGLTVDELTPQLRRRLGTERTDGVIVTEVDPNGVAAKDVQPGDIITSINGTKIGNIGDFRAAMRGADPQKGIRLTVEQQGMERFAFIKTDE